MVVVPARVAAWLAREVDLQRLRIAVRGQDDERDAVLVAIGVVAEWWTRARRAGAAGGTSDASAAEPTTSSGPMSTAEAAEALGISSRAVRRAIAERRLPAVRHGRGWLIDRADVRRYRPRACR